MLVVLMPNFAGGPSSHAGHKYSVVIDETQLAMFDDDVAVLQIAMRNAVTSQCTQKSQPLPRKMQQHLGPVEHFTDIYVERRTVNPLHEEDRKPVAADKYSFRCVGEIGKI